MEGRPHGRQPSAARPSPHGLCVAGRRARVSIFVWSMISIALWHLTIFIPDRFAGGIIGAFLAAWFGGMFSGWVFEGFALPSDNPPGFKHALYALPGSIG